MNGRKQTEGAGQRKQNKRKCSKATVLGQLYMDNISMGLNESDDSLISDSTEGTVT